MSHLNMLSEMNDPNMSTLLHSGVARWNSEKVWNQKDQNSREQNPKDWGRRSLPDVPTTKQHVRT